MPFLNRQGYPYVMMSVTHKTISILLISGILAAAIYISTDIICSIFYPGYSYTDQAISELSAIGAPTASLWKALTFSFNPLVIIFGMSVYFSAENKRALKMTGTLLILWGISGYAWLFYPMNMRGNIGSASDTGHLVLSAITVLLLTVILVSGSLAFSKKFRIYS